MQVGQRNSTTCNATDKMPMSLGCGYFRLFRFGVNPPPKPIYNLIDFFRNWRHLFYANKKHLTCCTFAKEIGSGKLSNLTLQSDCVGSVRDVYGNKRKNGI